jgi:hypothetical protein
MRTSLRKRFWLEAALATITSILFVITLFWKDWIEIVFGVDPDLGNGLLEWSIVGTLLVVTIVLLVLTRYEWRRIRIAPGQG